METSVFLLVVLNKLFDNSIPCNPYKYNLIMLKIHFTSMQLRKKNLQILPKQTIFMKC